MLEVKEFCIGYSNSIIQKDINWTVSGGEFGVILGRNGAGKSTFLRGLAGLQKASAGSVHWKEYNLLKIEPLKRAQIFAWMDTHRPETGYLTVRELIKLGEYPLFQLKKHHISENQDAVVSYLEICNLSSEYLDRRASSLSDGEFQRVMLAKALAQQTPLIFCDEPTAHADYTTRKEIFVLFKTLCESMNKTIIITTHEVELALKYADSLLFLQKNGVAQTGTPQSKELSLNIQKEFGIISRQKD